MVPLHAHQRRRENGQAVLLQCRAGIAIPSGLDCEVIDYIARIGTDRPRFDCGLQATRQRFAQRSSEPGADTARLIAVYNVALDTLHGRGGDAMMQIVNGVRRLFAVTRDFVFAAFDDQFWEGCGQ